MVGVELHSLFEGVDTFNLVAFLQAQLAQLVMVLSGVAGQVFVFFE